MSKVKVDQRDDYSVGSMTAIEITSSCIGFYNIDMQDSTSTTITSAAHPVSNPPLTEATRSPRPTCRSSVRLGLEPAGHSSIIESLFCRDVTQSMVSE